MDMDISFHNGIRHVVINWGSGKIANTLRADTAEKCHEGRPQKREMGKLGGKV